MSKTFHCIVAGSRKFNNYEMLKKELDYLLQNQIDVEIISGGAKGADSLAEKYADEKGYKKHIMPAEWGLYGKRAGYIRNEQMHIYASEYENRGCVCFWDGKSKGTAHNFELAERFNTPIKVINYGKERE